MDPQDYVHKLLKPDGSVEDYPPAGKTYTLEELQKAVGGYIEIVHPGDGRYLMVVNEEGKLHGLPPNPRATALYERDHIVGNALVCRNGDID